MGIYVYIQLIHFVIRQKLIVKQLYSHKDVKKNNMSRILFKHFFKVGWEVKEIRKC